MKKHLTTAFLSLLMLLALALPSAAASEANDFIHILYTNDIHCALEGLPAVAAQKWALEDLYGDDHVLMVDMGDAIQGGPIGTLTSGAAPVDMLNAVGYDFAVPGNHEFDYGMDTFLDLAQNRAEYDYLCCNLLDSQGKPLFKAYEMVDYGDVQVAFLGIATPETLTKSDPTHFQNDQGEYIYSFARGGEGQELYAAVQSTVDAARGAGADYVVAMGHLGIAGVTEEWTSPAVIANTTGIDLFLDGHSHETYETTAKNQKGEEIPLLQTGTMLTTLGCATIYPDGEIVVSQLAMTDDLPQDKGVADALAQIEEQFEAQLSQPVGQTSSVLVALEADNSWAVRVRETNLGDLVADAYRVTMGADIGVTNGGGIRNNIPAGPITYQDLLSVQPYGNELCLAEVTGQEVLDLLEIGVRLYPEPNGAFLQVSGLTYAFDPSIPSSVQLTEDGEFQGVTGPYRVSQVTVGGQPLELDKVYTLASHNYLIKSGGDGASFLRDNKLLKDCVVLDNQALIDYVTEHLGGQVGQTYSDPNGQGRITVLKDGETPVTPPVDVPPVEPEQPVFSDLDPNAWYYAAVQNALNKGLMAGTGAGIFSPNAQLTRAMVVQILYSMEGKPAVTGAAAFSDVAADAWYAAAVKWASDNKIVAGMGDGTFAPNANVTREQLAVILMGYAKAEGREVSVGENTNILSYDDALTISEWAIPGMQWACGAGIISGRTVSTLDPLGTATRAEMAQMILKFETI